MIVGVSLAFQYDVEKPSNCLYQLISVFNDIDNIIYEFDLLGVNFKYFDTFISYPIDTVLDSVGTIE